MRKFSTRVRTSAAVLVSAAGIAALGTAVAPAMASAATPAYSPGSVQAIAAQIVPANQLASFNQIVSHESSWNVTATNASSGAYGLVQALPGSKMASAGADWKTNPATQIKWGLNYMNERYGSPNAAWAFWQTHHWY
ncbi:transglycosylase SLT domain-containing protein [Kitasatospora sp. NPDC048540]|uniref:aggregation-promoting factor C-terminal-like domain-containing protein n=1 Tax=unclassified Kitasatospora TaxID=2633591 RepID=UPI00053980E4|nr:transglycosylase SLT domain-containing protein [Kitasatospora sp. MBT63]